jgi:hypothetical protein
MQSTVYCCKIVMRLEFSSTNFFSENAQISNFMKIRPVGAELFRADGRTDMANLILAFRKIFVQSSKWHVMHFELLLGKHEWAKMFFFKLQAPNVNYSWRTAPLTPKRSILYIYSTNIGTEYFKHGIYSPFFFHLQNGVCFIILTYLVPVLFTFYIQGVLKLQKIIPAPKG